MAGGKQRRSRKRPPAPSLATAAASGAHAIAESVATLLMIEQGLRQQVQWITHTIKHQR